MKTLKKVVLVLFGVPLIALGQTDFQMTPTQFDAKTQLSELEWMAGLWGGEVEGVWQEEYWLAPRGGMMVGVHRDVRSSGGVLFEFLRIEATQDGLIYYASPRGRAPATPYRLRTLESERVVFANPDHDFPQIIEYWLENNTLHARIEGPSSNGEVQSMEWTWPRLGRD